MYATKDGNVYKNTGSGWQSYDNGSWNSVKQAPQGGAPQSATVQQSAQQRAQGAQGSASGQGSASQFQGVQQDHEARQRGSFQSGQLQHSRGSGGGGGRRR